MFIVLIQKHSFVYKGLKSGGHENYINVAKL